MKIFALKGHGESGKTTTLKILILKIYEHYPNLKIIYSNVPITKNNIIIDIHNERINRRKNSHFDIENLQIVINIDLEIIGINTAGDNEHEVNKSIDIFKKYKCDIGFCACRSKGITTKKLYKHYKNDIDFIFKSEIKNSSSYKNFDDWIDLLNEWQAKELFDLI